MNKPVLYIVVPCYNEEEVLPETSKRLKVKLSDLIVAGKVSEDSRVLFVDDGSKDRTWEPRRPAVRFCCCAAPVPQSFPL